MPQAYVLVSNMVRRCTFVNEGSGRQDLDICALPLDDHVYPQFLYAWPMDTVAAVQTFDTDAIIAELFVEWACEDNTRLGHLQNRAQALTKALSLVFLIIQRS